MAGDEHRCGKGTMTDRDSTSSTSQSQLIFSGRARSSSRFTGSPTAILHAHRRGASPQYVDRRVVIGMGRETAMLADKDRLALATLAVNGPAFRTRLACVSGWHLNQFTAAFFEFVCKDGFKREPALIENDAVQSGLLSNLTSWSVQGARCTRCHVGNLQIFQDYNAVTLRNTERGLVLPVFTNSRSFGCKLGGTLDGHGSAAGPLLLSGAQSLRASVPVLYCEKFGWQRQAFTSRQNERIGHAPVNSNRRKFACGRRMLNFPNKGNMPISIPRGDGYIHQATRHFPGISEFDPSEFRNSNGRPFGVQLSNRNIAPHKTEAIVDPLFSVRGIFRAAFKERIERRIQISQSADKAIIGYSFNPLVLSSKCLQLRALAYEIKSLSGRTKMLPPKVPALLKGQIVNEARYASELLKELSLLVRRVKPIAKSAMDHFKNLATNAAFSSAGANP